MNVSRIARLSTIVSRIIHSNGSNRTRNGLICLKKDIHLAPLSTGLSSTKKRSTLSRAVVKEWRTLNAEGRHKDVIQKFTAIPQGDALLSSSAVHHELVKAFAYAYDHSKATEHAHAVLTDNVLHKRAAVAIAIHAYARADKLSDAEYLLAQWLEAYAAEAPEATASRTLALVASLSASRGENGASYTRAPDAVAQLSDEHRRALRESPPGPQVWLNILRLYAQRRAADNCLVVLCYLEDEPRTRQWANQQVYHHSVRALCDSGRFSEASELVERMRTSRGMSPALGTLSALVKSVRQLSIPREVALRVAGEAVNFLVFLAQQAEAGRSRGNSSSSSSSPSSSGSGAGAGAGTGASRGVVGVDWEGANLASVVVSALCARGLATQAEQLVRELATGGAAVGPFAVTELLRAFAHAREATRALALFRWACDQQLVADPLAYHLVCRAFERAGDAAALDAFVVEYGSAA
jgi:pentatricopeptide repeat protein